MNIRARMLKVAENLMKDVVKSFEMTEDEWKKYSELHPAAKRENHTIIPDRKNQGGNGGGMTDEQKKIHDKYLSGGFEDWFSISNNPNAHPYTLHKLSIKNNDWIRRGVADNPSTHPKTLEELSKLEDEGLRSIVLDNPNTPKKIKEKLINQGTIPFDKLVEKRKKEDEEEERKEKELIKKILEENKRLQEMPHDENFKDEDEFDEDEFFGRKTT